VCCYLLIVQLTQREHQKIPALSLVLQLAVLRQVPQLLVCLTNTTCGPRLGF
jgi:hypothetical protein